jgi:hypothetical protein
LRYRRPSLPLPLPQRAPVHAQRRFTPFLAAAAALLVMTLAAGLWFALGPQAKQKGLAVISVEPGRAQEGLNPDSLFAASLPELDEPESKPAPQFVAAKNSRSDKPRRSLEPNRRAQDEQRTAELLSRSGRERVSEDEGVAAREQLIQALQLASSKLHRVQKKVQDNKSLGPVS